MLMAKDGQKGNHCRGCAGVEKARCFRLLASLSAWLSMKEEKVASHQRNTPATIRPMANVIKGKKYKKRKDE